MKRLILGICSVAVLLASVLLMKSNDRAKQPDLFNDNVEALAWSEQIIVGALCGWSPDVWCKYMDDHHEVFYLEGILVPW